VKAAVITRYGSPDVVKILDAPKPTPAADEVLVRVHAATVNRTDCGELRAHRFFTRLFYGLRRPRRTAIADAYRYVETGQKVGIVVINVAAPDESAPGKRS
jgi:NADPH:quinone reductase-like Zn-dependent oxidoreductase